MFQYSDDHRGRQGMFRPYHVMLVLGLGLYLWMSRGRFAPPPPPPNVADLAELRNVGIAQLENLDFEQAAATLENLAEDLPSERLAFQNLAIARLLAIHPDYKRANLTPEQMQRAVEKAEVAVLTLIERFPGAAESRLLSARFANSDAVRNPIRAIDELTTAAEARPKDAAIQFEIYQTAKEQPERANDAFVAIKRCHELAPNNLYVLTELLMAQVEHRDATVKETLTLAREQLHPFVQRVEQFARLNLNDHIDRGLTIFERVKDSTDAAGWTQLRGNIAIMTNVLRPEIAWQLDRKRVLRHLLEYVIHDFSPAFYAHAQLPDPPLAEEIPVSLKTAAKLPELAGARSVRLADFDADGRMDVVAVLDNRLVVIGQPQPGSWKEVASIELPIGTRGFVLFDLDRDRALLAGFKEKGNVECADSRLDVLAWGDGGVTLILNEAPEGAGAPRLSVVKPVDGMFEGLADVLTALPVDFDHDGDLDVIVSSKTGLSLWLNRDDNSFVDVSQYSTLPPSNAGIHSLIAVDWNRNVSIDVVCLGNGVAGVLENVLHGRVRWQPLADDHGLPKDASSMVLVDADSNFSWDLVVGSPKAVTFARTSNPDGGVTKFTGPRSLQSQGVSGLQSWDYDNDGSLDLLLWNGQEVTVMRGGPLGQFVPAPNLTLKLDADIVAVDVDDIDNDGDQDAVCLTASGATVVMNNGGSANHSIRLPIRGESDKNPQRRSERVNMHAIGSLIELRAGQTYVPQVVTRQWTHFGLGKLSQPDALRILWTNGVPDQILAPKAGEAVCLQQKLKGSCPYLYTWDGEKFVFFTDCLWAAPIGLQLADGVTAPAREWEYLKIDGDRLVATDGEYRLSLTEELWEIGYIDTMKLFAVDHPADIEIFSNEKVGPPSIADFKLHPVRKPHAPVRAVDQRGRDVLEKIARRDDVYLQAWDRRIKQGYTEPHFVELDLGKLDQPRDIKLFLTGWIRPTDTSLNVAISQRPDLEPTQPPSVWVPDATGTWQKVVPFMGFPGGKTKTVVVDLSKVFLTNDYRVRIATTMEISWDQIFFTVNEPAFQETLVEQSLLGATLNYRGFSTLIPHSNLGPDRYDYLRLHPQLSWPPMEGHLTPYGDVGALIAEADNQQVTVGAGDELVVRFKATGPELKRGWKRDFILRNVGWDKDADLNTVFGQSVDPLPFSAMKSYPDPAGPGENPPFANQQRIQDRTKFWRLFHDINRVKRQP